ncbi:alpha/beta hydrolase [Lysinibacillus sphaericus]|uniref:Alpha/beta superfamily hydrolase n=1 Tax=Lysinibacillus sphaericus OT4b.31 TaxID=1285586 RepID=R7ZD63_LYSSH|nr:alpha/beta fold hydrolase [Lysinibacillus sphaericus]EON71964.1 alpha/beta superfamily hydrolase [Lysinibacillus sphaericus OT4b.31]
MKKLLVVCFIALLLVACTQKEKETHVDKTEEVNDMNEQLIGKWAGDIEIPNGPLAIIVDLQKNDGSFSVPAQGLSNYPFKSVKYDGNQVSVSINLNGSAIKIDGALKGQQIEATFNQNGGKFTLLLKPYEEQPVSYETITVPVNNGDLTVALQKTSKKPSPVVLILAGSGPTDKDGNSAIAGKNNSLKMLAEGLANEGVATVRYDKRGIGDNLSLLTKEEDVSIDQYVDDAVQVINTLLADKAYSSVHIIGHSEGSLIGMLAAQKTSVESFVSIAGAGRPIDEILEEQLAGQLTPALMKETTNILSSLKKGLLVENVSPELQALFRPSVQPYMMSWLKYNPISELQKLNSRVLIIQGTTDIQVKGTDAEALKNGKKDAELLSVEGMNHVLKTAPADREGNLATYANPALPLHQDLLPAIHRFIVSD